LAALTTPSTPAPGRIIEAWAGWAGPITSVCGTFGFISLGFLADAIGRRPTAMLWYAMSLALTPLVYL